MVWVSAIKPAEGVKAFLDRQFTHGYRVLDSALVALSEYYAAVEKVYEDGRREVRAAVFLVKFCGEEICFKGIHEDMGPTVARCPERILARLTHTDDKDAQQWRARCWERLKKLHAIPAMKKGVSIHFEKPVPFGQDRRPASNLNVLFTKGRKIYCDTPDLPATILSFTRAWLERHVLDNNAAFRAAS